MGTDLPNDLAARVDSVCDAFERAWIAGQRPRVEDLLSDAAAPARTALLRELLRLELDYRVRAGEQPRVEEYRARFRDFPEELAQLFRQAPADFRVTLTVTGGPHAGKSFTFSEHDSFVVGRSPEARFALPEKDRYFSRFHFMVEVNPPLCRLADLGSHNGTMVNNCRVDSAELRDGDEITAGTTVLKVRVEGTAVPTTPNVTKPGPAAPAGPATDQTLTTPPAGMTETLNSPDTPVQVGPLVPGFTVLRELGRGAMGVVYQARSAAGTIVALKTVLPAVKVTPAALDRFLREATILRELSHPNIVTFHEMNEAGGLLYFAMEYVPGRDVGSLLRASGPLAVGRAVALACQLLDALAYAHGKGFVHRDIKPGNLLVAEENGKETLRVADFGLARTYQCSQLSGLTMLNTPGGTPPFMPPEQVLNFRMAKPAADQYSAMATLYNLLTGDYVHGRCACAAEAFRRILQSPLTPLRSLRAEVPARLEAVIHRGLAREPGDRYPDAASLRRDLLPFAT